ncbi:unnamed protein product [Adineta ricciae]|uniref:Uncharacterized protein n=1 Tax=Adineta ricciae TaxID=249248 RepID=A0A815UAS6_ADIRI|nr:unnamed protein product [Adineta ricciae]
MPTFESNFCDDISNSQRSQEIASKERQTTPTRNYVTLTLNTDGVLLKRISRSLWITCACINELPRNKRYDINNMLICSLSTGEEKPKKDEYSAILQDIVNELKFLEQIGVDIMLPSNAKNPHRTYTHFYAFAIAAVCDKPAQALMMNIKDPTGFFSCDWCCIPGETHLSNSRCFINNSATPAMLRTNKTYDHFMQILDANYVTKDPSKDRVCGHAGPCALRQLTYFEIGNSFCYDSLHGLYAGVFKKLMHLWLDTKLLQSIHYPLTNRLPRALKHYTTWKANEFRMTLLFGYKAFEQVMKKKYYEHLRLLVYAAVFSEARVLTTTRLNQIESLLNAFVDEFPVLYGASNCVSIVHSLSHVHQSLLKFGPIHNYSTFNFESTVVVLTNDANYSFSLLGSFVKSVHGPTLILKQLMNKFELLSYATTLFTKPDFHPKVALLINQIFSSKRRALPTCLTLHNVTSLTRSTVSPSSHVTEYLGKLCAKDHYTHYSTCFYRNVAFTIHRSNNKQVDNSAVMYSDHSNNLQLGIIIAIIQLTSTKDIVIIIDQADVVGFDRFSQNQTEYINDFVAYAKHSDPPHIVSIDCKSIREKVAYRKDPNVLTSVEYYIFPNLVEET